ncbi:MAG: phage tail tape measure protein [Thermoleophilia bacterium]
MALKVGELFGTLKLDDGPFNRTLSMAGSGLGTLMKTASVAAVAGGAAIVAGAAVAGAAIVKIGMSYQDSLNVFKSVSGANAAQMQMVADMAKQLGNDLTLPGISAADAALAMTQLARAGLTVEQSMAAAKGVLQLAKAAEVDVGTAADMTAVALNAFGLSGDQAVHVADLLAAAANSSMGEITDMGFAMSQSAAIFAAAGVPVEALTSSIAMLANKGILGSDAGTSLKTMLMSLQPEADGTQKLFTQLGVSAYDANGAMKDYRQIISEVSGALSPLTQAQKDQALQAIFGSDAARAANIIFGQGVEAYDASYAAVTKQGAAQEVAAARAQGLSGAIENVKSTMETWGISIYEKIAPSLEEMVRGFSDSMTSAAEWASSISDKFRQVRDSMNAGGSFADAMRSAFGDDSWLTGFADKISAFRDKILEIWNNPAVQAAIEVFVMNMKLAGQQLGPIFDNLKQIFQSLLPLLKLLGMVIGGALLVGLAALGIAANIVARAFRAVTEVWTVVIGYIGVVYGFFLMLATGVIQMFQNLYNNWSAIWSAMWSFLVGIVTAMVSSVSANFGELVAFVSGAASGAYSAVAGAFNDMIGAVAGAIGTLISTVAGLPGQILGALGDTGTMLYDAGKRIIQGLIDGIGSMAGAVGDKIGEIAASIRDHLPFSPAKTGPLSGKGNPYNSGLSIANMLAGGMLSGSNAVNSAVGRLAAGMQFGPVAAGAYGASTYNSSAANTYNITIHASGGDDAYDQFIRRVAASTDARISSGPNTYRLRPQ